jgi:hypothetical protein
MPYSNLTLKNDKVNKKIKEGQKKTGEKISPVSLLST